MAENKKAQTPIAPYYYLVQEDFLRLRDKLKTAMVRPSMPMGLEIVDGKAALKNWEQGLHRSTRRIPSLLHVFSNTILARSRRPSSRDTQRTLIPLEQEVNNLLALHRQLWQQPLYQNFGEGQVLLSRCIEKIVTDLDDLFTFFISTAEVCAAEVDEARSTSHVWAREINCRLEMSAYKCWWRDVAQPTTPTRSLTGLPRLVQRLMGRTEARNVLFCRV